MVCASKYNYLMSLQFLFQSYLMQKSKGIIATADSEWALIWFTFIYFFILSFHALLKKGILTTSFISSNPVVQLSRNCNQYFYKLSLSDLKRSIISLKLSISHVPNERDKTQREFWISIKLINYNQTFSHFSW